MEGLVLNAKVLENFHKLVRYSKASMSRVKLPTSCKERS